VKKLGNNILFSLLIVIYCFAIGLYNQELGYKTVSYKITDANKSDLNPAHFKIEFYTSPASQNSFTNLTTIGTSFCKESLTKNQFEAIANNHFQNNRFYNYIRFTYSFVTLFSVADIIFPFHYFW